MREIEIKARVHDIATLRVAIDAANLELGAPMTQHDVVYCKPDALTGTPGYNFLRIRTIDNSTSVFTLKQTVKGLDKIEHETEIADPKEMATMIELMHYELFSDLTKSHQIAKAGEYELCLDEIDGLGTFIEVEKLCGDDVDGDAVRDELWGFLQPFGISRDDEVTKGYDVLMRDKLAHDDA